MTSHASCIDPEVCNDIARWALIRNLRSEILNILRKWKIYTANAGPTDLPEKSGSENFWQASSRFLQKWTIYTVNAGPTDLRRQISKARKSEKPANRCPPWLPGSYPPRPPRYQNRGFSIDWVRRPSENHIKLVVGVYNNRASWFACNVTIAEVIKIA